MTEAVGVDVRVGVSADVKMDSGVIVLLCIEYSTTDCAGFFVAQVIASSPGPSRFTCTCEGGLSLGCVRSGAATAANVNIKIVVANSRSGS